MLRDSVVLQSLVQRLQDMEHGAVRERVRVIGTGWRGVDEALGGLPTGVAHEWFSQENGLWLPAVGVMVHLAGRALKEGAMGEGEGGRIGVWIGRRCWPCLADWPGLAGRMVMLDVEGLEERVWAMELALRSRGVGCAVLNGEGLSMALTRRLQIAAGAGDALALVARPCGELGRLSAAGTRWRVSPGAGVGVGGRPRWMIELLRHKGVWPGSGRVEALWTVESEPWG